MATIEELRAALQRAIAGTMAGHIPVRPEDDDVILAAALDELAAARPVVATIEAWYAALVAYRASLHASTDPVSFSNGDWQWRAREMQVLHQSLVAVLDARHAATHED